MILGPLWGTGNTYHVPLFPLFPQMSVVSDTTYPAGTGLGICPGANVCRYVNYQIKNFSGITAGTTNVCEAPVLTGWSCTQAQPTPNFAGCPSLAYSGSNGQFTDEWSLGSASYTPSGCGFNISDTWKWGYPSPPTPLGLLTGYIHTNAIQINGVTSPASMTNGTIIPQ
jgi:hypothetical protein